MGDGAPIKQVPGFTIGEDAPTADDACVEKIKPLLARPVDLPVRFADQHCLAMVDGDLARTDLNFEWHNKVSLRSCSRTCRYITAQRRDFRYSGFRHSLAMAQSSCAPNNQDADLRILGADIFVRGNLRSGRPLFATEPVMRLSFSIF